MWIYICMYNMLMFMFRAVDPQHTVWLFSSLSFKAVDAEKIRLDRVMIFR